MVVSHSLKSELHQFWPQMVQILLHLYLDRRRKWKRSFPALKLFCSSAPDKIFTSELIDWLITKCVEGFDVDRPAGERIVEQL